MAKSIEATQTFPFHSPRSAMNRRPQDDLTALLSRERFHALCMARSNGRCVLCTQPAVDAHHIFDRKLFPDGGYRLANAAAVCPGCHWDAERGAVLPTSILLACSVDEPLLPPWAQGCGLFGPEGAAKLDKWGNLLREDGSMAPGPLFNDDGCRKALAAGGWLAKAFEAGDFPWRPA
jgi:hypothetical protein